MASGSSEVGLPHDFSERLISLSAINNRGRRCWSSKRISEREDNTDPPADIVAAVVPLVNVGRQITLDDHRS